MRFAESAIALLCASVPAFGFPALENLAKLSERSAVGLETKPGSFVELYESLLQIKERGLLFDPLSTPLDVSGTHAFKPPNFDRGDQRGPCPGLNAMANHGYIPRDGIVGFVDLIAAANKVYGMGVDLGLLLAIMGTVGVGNPVSLNPGFSIGGPSSKSNNILGNAFGLLGKPRGLYGSHNLIESDGSGTRDDLFVTGNAHTMNLTLFKMVLDSADNGVITMDTLRERAVERFYEAIGTNPYFYYGPYTGMIARNTGYVFLGRYVSNHSVEYPQGGHITIDVLKSFYGVYEENGEMVYKEGWEQIPPNWYRLQNDYIIQSLNADLTEWMMKSPVLASIGGNMGAVNTFAGLEIGDVTDGLMNAALLLEGNNLMCFGLEIVQTFVPNILSSVLSTLNGPLALLDKALLGPIADLSCPSWGDLRLNGTDLWTGLLNTYPGASKAGSSM